MSEFQFLDAYLQRIGRRSHYEAFANAAPWLSRSLIPLGALPGDPPAALYVYHDKPIDRAPFSATEAKDGPRWYSVPFGPTGPPPRGRMD